jgi:phage baseplate assembly protein V
MPFETPELDIQRYQEGMVRCGRVTKVSTDNCVAATVTFPDRNFQSGYMTVLQRNTLGTNDFYVPEEGEPVWVMMAGRSLSRGLILGSAYTDDNPPPYNSRTIRGVKFKDGTFIIYDAANGGNYQINSAGKLTATTVGDANVTVGGNLVANVTGNASLKSPNITLDGAVTVTKTLTVQGVCTFSAGGSATPSIINTDGSGNGS